MNRHLTMVVFSFILIFSFWACQNSQSPMEQSNPLAGDLSLNKLVLPDGATVTSAVLYLYAWEANALQTVNVHRVTEEWIESEVTWIDRVAGTNWGSAGGSYDPNVEASFVPAAVGWVSVDITDLVNKWINEPGTYPNYGMLLKQDALSLTTRYWSRENGTNIPYVEITYNGTTVQISGADLPDAFIRSTVITPVGGADRLAMGNDIEDPKKRVLLKFDIESTPDDGDGCTLTPGYWKTHSKYGPAPYDETWGLIGEDTGFFLSGQSYYDVLWTEPKGNAYYILAHAYIAAELNELNDADFSVAEDAFEQATNLFEAYTPEDVDGMKGGKNADKETRALFVSLAEILDDYNNGIIGPGHCD
jgi:hypothetical protein